MNGRLAAVILAGGRGERLGGVIKANLEIGGRRLLDRVTDTLGPLPAPVLVACGAIPPEQLDLRAGQVPVPDLDSGYAGPLAGLAGALAWLEASATPPDAVLTVAVDTPFLPLDFAAAMLAALGSTECAVLARHAGQDYPTNAVWRFEAVRTLPARIATATAPRSLRRLADELGATRLDWPAAYGGDPFANANTPADLAALEMRARTS